MPRIRRAVRAASLPVALAAAVTLAGCGTAPEPGTTTAASSDYCARMVTNSGGLQDRSFNQSSWEGLQRAEAELGIQADVLVSTSETDLAPNVEQAVGTGCGFILTVGYELAEATQAQAAANPEVHFSIVDEVVDAPNVKPVVFDTAQASYLAGYLAAGVSQTGKVGTFGGGNQPPVTLFMDGFVDGVAAYNQAHGTSVQALGWDAAAQDGTFTGDFEDVSKGQTTTQNLLDQGADVIMPVAGQVGEGAASAILAHGSGKLIWVDNDGYDTLPAEYRPLLLTSVLKDTGQAVVDIVGDDQKGSFSSEPYVGTLANGGVGLAEYHDLAASVPTALQSELDALKARIVSGDVQVKSVSTP